MLRPDGVYHRAVVSFRMFRPGSSYSVWTDPFPKLVSPMSTARSWSCSAPATISVADALRSPISTATSRSGYWSSRVARKTRLWPGDRPRVSRISCRRSRNRSATFIPWSSSPPVFRRMSSTSDVAPCSRSRSMAWIRLSVAVSLNTFSST